jgi:sigma-B regulation protein RsbU (phosphoserine phosphatase)
MVISPKNWEYGSIASLNNPVSGRSLFRDIREGAMRPGEPIPARFPSTGGDREILMYSEFVRPLKWYVTGVGFVDEIRAPGRRLSTALTLGILSATFFLALAAVFLIGKLTAPLARLADFARQLPQTDFFREQDDGGILGPLSAGSGDEIGELSRAFLFMDGALRQRVRELVETTGARERMEGELRTATEIQMGFLPDGPKTEKQNRFAFSGLLVPARGVGGDLYDFLPLDSNRICLVIGDVSDKGVPAALFMSMTLVLIRAGTDGAIGPEKILESVNRALANENRNSMFVTLFIAFLDLSTGELVYANAGHNPPWLCGLGGMRQLDGLSGPMAGAFKDAEYRPFTARMLPGDTLFLYTDGITEAMNGRNEPFGDDALENILARWNGLEPESLLRQVSAAIDDHVGGAAASDDITMTCLVYSGEA